MLKLFSRYLSIGVLNTVIHWAVFYLILCTSDATQSLANFGAFCVAVTFSFFANARWTFNSETTTLRYTTIFKNGKLFELLMHSPKIHSLALMHTETDFCNRQI